MKKQHIIIIIVAMLMSPIVVSIIMAIFVNVTEHDEINEQPKLSAIEVRELHQRYFNNNNYRITPIAQALIRTNINGHYRFSSLKSVVDQVQGKTGPEDHVMDSIEEFRSLSEKYYDRFDFPVMEYYPGQVNVYNCQQGVGDNDYSFLAYSELSDVDLLSLNPGYSLFQSNEIPQNVFSWFWKLEGNWYICSPRRNASYNRIHENDSLYSQKGITDYWNQQKDTIKYVCKLLSNLERETPLVLSNYTYDGFFSIKCLYKYETFPRKYFGWYHYYMLDYGTAKTVCGKLDSMYPDFCPFRFKYYNKRYFDIEVLSSNHLHFYIFLTKEAYYEVADDVDLQWLERGCYYSN